jgi:hypothetical protein
MDGDRFGTRRGGNGAIAMVWVGSFRTKGGRTLVPSGRAKWSGGERKGLTSAKADQTIPSKGWRNAGKRGGNGDFLEMLRKGVVENRRRNRRMKLLGLLDWYILRSGQDTSFCGTGRTGVPTRCNIIV